MTIPLTPEQSETVKAKLRPGHVLICKVAREMFTGENTMTSGNPILDFVTIPETALVAIREIIKRS